MGQDCEILRAESASEVIQYAKKKRKQGLGDYWYLHLINLAWLPLSSRQKSFGKSASNIQGG
jgi:hypothetical protein